MTRPRHGIALVATLAVVSLIAILAVATLSVTTRLNQGSALAARDARLEAAASQALSAVFFEWRRQSLGLLGVGSTRRVDVPIVGSPIIASFTVTRLATQLFWVVAEATAVDESRRSENLVLRLLVPPGDSMAALIASGSVVLSRDVMMVRDSVPGCAPASADLMMGPTASLTSSDGALPPVTVARSSAVSDSIYRLGLENFDTAAIAATADVLLTAGATVPTPSGVVHALGDLTLTAGSGQGMLIVDGRLNLAGPISFSGVIIAKGGIATMADGATLTGSIRSGPSIGGAAAGLELVHRVTIHPNACVVQTALNTSVRPRRVAGRHWAEMY